MSTWSANARKGERTFAEFMKGATASPRVETIYRYAEAAGVERWDHTPAALPPATDLMIAAHAHVYIPGSLRAQARLGAIGYHPSLLPLHRGRDAIRWALHMGERVTGGTVYRMDDNVDTGPVLAQEHVLVRPGDTPLELWRRELAPLGLKLFEQVLAPGFDLGGGAAQDEALATWEPSWERPPLARG